MKKLGDAVEIWWQTEGKKYEGEKGKREEGVGVKGVGYTILEKS